MSRRLNAFFLLAIIFALLCVSSTKANKKNSEKLGPHCGCGKVYDGDKQGKDIDTQSSTSSISGNWEGFGTEVEVCVISEDQATKIILDSEGFEAPDNTRCRSKLGLDKGDTPFADFEKVPKGDSSFTFDGLDLDEGSSYFFVVRYVDHGEPHYSSSNGVVPGGPKKGRHTNTHKKDGGSGSDDGGSDSGHNHSDGSGSGGESSSSDDDDLADWQIGLIAMGCALCCLLLLLLILLLVLAKGKGDDKYTTTVHRNDNVDKL